MSPRAVRTDGRLVRSDVSGYALPAGSGPEHYASVIRGCAQDAARYRELAHSSRDFYDRHPSWDLFGERLMAIVGAASPCEMRPFAHRHAVQ
jgi:hypothetical protein